MERARIDCVGGVVTDPWGRFLMVRRGNEPARGLWSVPGGRVEPGESDAEATAREVLEETGLRVVVGALVGSVERDAPDGGTYVIRDYLCAPAEGIDPSVVRAADDADDAGWFTADEVRALDCSPGLVEALVGWGVLPPATTTFRPADKQVVEKVVCYVVRDTSLLVFRHLDEPWEQTGIQVPAGTLMPGEDPAAGAVREAAEETGLAGLRVVRKLGEVDYDISPDRFEVQHRHVFLMAVDGDVPTRWESREAEPEGGGDVHRYACFWIPLTDAHVLQSGQGALLGTLFD